MPFFSRAADAYEWAVSILQVRRGAHGARYERGLDGELSLSFGGRTPSPLAEERLLDAIKILGIIERHDISTEERPSWFSDYYTPAPTTPPTPFSYMQIIWLTERIKDFECDLAREGYIAHCGASCRKRNRKRARIKILLTNRGDKVV